MTKAIVGLATCGIAAGAETVLRSLKEKVEAQKLPVEVGITGCIGMCYQEPLLEIRPDNGDRYIYGRVNEKRLDRVLKQHVQEGNPIEELLVWTNNGLGSDREFLNRQVRIVLRNCGLIDPESIDDYIAQGGYKAIEKAMEELSPDALIGLMIESGLRGRGGAGFPTGMKWRFTRLSPGERKYIICNADEGDPGAFMDRSVLEGDPHSVLEGMIVAGYAIGAHEGYIYVRAEYPKAIERLKIAIEQANAKGFLGEGIFGTDFRFTIKIKEGAGAFVCGEETALMKSIEGSRGMPRIRPPFPAVKGLWDFPTSINNVETFANVPWIVLNGAEAYNQYGTELSKGTKVFALAGKINRGGLVEVPMGVTIHDIVDGICGGIKENRRFKAVQIGGPSGGCIPTQLQDTIIDYDSISRTGAIMGSGGMVVMDETTCMVDVAKFFLDFTQRESCGKCTFCRIGTKRMLEILTRITEGNGKQSDLPLLEDLANKVKDNSLCGLGQTAPNPVLTTLKYFRGEYEAHILSKKCPAHDCIALITFTVIPELCDGCTACAKICPVQCISGTKGEVHLIDQSLCTKCGECYRVCPIDAILKD
jgi:NADH-quinone oxidoreductase subunit F